MFRIHKNMKVFTDGKVVSQCFGNVEYQMDKSGYILVDCMGSTYKQHTLLLDAFQPLYPKELSFIDHKNRIRSDNRLSNIRRISPSLNNLNRTGVRGYYFESEKWMKKNGKRGIARNLWIASFQYKGTKHEVGTYKSSRIALLECKKAREIFITNELNRIWAVFEQGEN